MLLSIIGADQMTAGAIHRYTTEAGADCRIYGHYAALPTTIAENTMGITLLDCDHIFGFSSFASLIEAQKQISQKVIVMLNPYQRAKLPELKAMGVDAYLIKPIRKASLMKLLEPEPENGTSISSPITELSKPRH